MIVPRVNRTIVRSKQFCVAALYPVAATSLIILGRLQASYIMCHTGCASNSRGFTTARIDQLHLLL